jgi:hypothetical protein
MAQRRPDLIQLLAQNLAALIRPQPAHRLRTFAVAQIIQSADHQLGRNALPKVGASPHLERDPKFLQDGLQRKTDSTGPVQNGDLLSGTAAVNQLGDGAPRPAWPRFPAMNSL